jgi:hypothetical protein
MASRVQSFQEVEMDENRDGNENTYDHFFSFELESLNGIKGHITTESFSIQMEVVLADPDDKEEESSTSLYSKPVEYNGNFTKTVFPISFKPPQNQTTAITLKFIIEEEEDGGGSIEYGIVKHLFKKSFNLIDLLSQRLDVFEADAVNNKKIGKGRFVLADSSQILKFKIDLPIQAMKASLGINETDPMIELIAALSKPDSQGNQPKVENIDSSFETHLSKAKTKEVSNNVKTVDLMVEMYKLKEEQKLFVCLALQTTNTVHYLIADFMFKLKAINSSPDLESKENLTFRRKNGAALTPQVKMNVSRLSSVSLTNALKNMYKLNFHLEIAIDFTASNTNNSGEDLHDLQRGPNQYQKVIDLIGNTIYQQSVMKPILVYFFGLATKLFASQGIGTGLETVFFAKETNTIEEVKDSYKTKVAEEKDRFGANTSFVDFTKKFFDNYIELYSSKKDVFSILLIITDGILEEKEMKDMIDLIAKMADHNISIIIVGVGNADFKDMKKLDGDAGEDGLPALMDSKGNRVKRDIVQFVQFKDNTDKETFREEIFYELPRQIISFQAMKKQAASSNSL